MHRNTTGWLLFVLCGTGCAESAPMPVLAAVDMVGQVAAEAALLAIEFDGTLSTSSPVEAATRAAANLQKALTPEGCATVQAADHVVSATLNGCMGPYGMPRLAGEFTTTYAKMSVDGSRQLQATLAATKFHIESAVVDLLTVASVAPMGGMNFNSTSSGLSGRGFDFQRRGDYAALWDSKCLHVDAEWALDVNKFSWTTTIEGFVGCTGACPESGSVEIASSDPSVVYGVIYNGTSAAIWSSTSDQPAEVAVACHL